MWTPVASHFADGRGPTGRAGPVGWRLAFMIVVWCRDTKPSTHARYRPTLAQLRQDHQMCEATMHFRARTAWRAHTFSDLGRVMADQVTGWGRPAHPPPHWLPPVTASTPTVIIEARRAHDHRFGAMSRAQRGCWHQNDDHEPRPAPVVLVWTLRVTVDGRDWGGGGQSLQKGHTQRRSWSAVRAAAFTFVP